MFTDKVNLQLVAGKGGAGVVAWRRERYLPKGGPMGGNGGPGGDVILRANDKVFSLDALRGRHRLVADAGKSGGPDKQQGGKGLHLILDIPCGTLVKDIETGALLADLTHHGEQFVICKGGRGGRGNASFRSAKRRTPNFCLPGSEGEEKKIEMELKLIADVGLVGFPNAGKSTLIEGLAKVPVKIAPYPFTTLRPNLGYIEYEDYSRLLLADIPGLIEGAHTNRGLGFAFLRHVERTKALLYVLDLDGRDPVEDYRVLRAELAAYNPELLDRPSLIVLNKCDIAEPIDFPGAVLISAKTGEGFAELGEALYDFCQTRVAI